jgi:hypothetical protein
MTEIPLFSALTKKHPFRGAILLNAENGPPWSCVFSSYKSSNAFCALEVRRLLRDLRGCIPP